MSNQYRAPGSEATTSRICPPGNKVFRLLWLLFKINTYPFTTYFVQTIVRTNCVLFLVLQFLCNNWWYLIWISFESDISILFEPNVRQLINCCCPFLSFARTYLPTYLPKMLKVAACYKLRWEKLAFWQRKIFFDPSQRC